MPAKKQFKVKFKKVHEDATTPTYAHAGDAGLDLTAVSKEVTSKYIEYDTGIAFEIPKGYVGLLFPRSSVSNKDISLANSVGVIDSSYKGTVRARFNKNDSKDKGAYKYSGTDYAIGEKVAQLIIIPYPEVTLEEIKELETTDRGEGGFGSSDKKETIDDN